MSVRSDFVASFLRHAAAGDLAGALDLVDRLLADGVSPRFVTTNVILPAQRRVGDLWLTGGLGVAEEHVASAVADAVLTRLFPHAPAALEGADVLVTCAEGEWHVLPCRLAADVLLAGGHRARSLGGSLAAVDLVVQLERRRPTALLVGCSLSWGLAGAARTVAAAQGLGVPVIVGGAAFGPDGRHAGAVGADAWAEDPWQAEALVRSWADRGAPTPSPPAGGGDDVLAVEAHRLEIGARLLDRWCLQLPDAAGDDGLLQLLGASAVSVAQMAESAVVAGDGSVLADGLRWQAAAFAGQGVPVDLTPSAVELLCSDRWPEPLGRVAEEAVVSLERA